MGLLDAGVHKDRATAAQVDRSSRMQRLFGKVLDAVAQAAGKGLDKGAAARRAGLVEHDVLYDAVLDAQALHVLAADIQDELDAGKHLLRTAQMGNRLDLSAIGFDGFKQETLAIAGDGGMTQLYQQVAVVVFGHGIPKLTQHTAASAQNVAFVRGVKALEQLSVLTDQRAFERRGASIDSQVDLAAIRREVCAGHGMLGMALVEFAILVLVGKQGVKTHDLAALDVAQIAQTLFDFAQRESLVVFAA